MREVWLGGPARPLDKRKEGRREQEENLRRSLGGRTVIVGAEVLARHFLIRCQLDTYLLMLDPLAQTGRSRRQTSF